MRIFCAAAILALLAVPALAQEKQVPQYGDLGKPKTLREIDEEKSADQAYKKSLGNIPDKGPVDPWSSARTDAPKSVAKAAPKSVAKTTPAKSTKTGSTAN